MLQGTIPLLPSDYLLQKLEPHHQNLIQLAMAGQLPTDPEISAEIDTALDLLELGGVWGKLPEGYAWVRAFLLDEEHLFIHTVTHTWDDPDVPAEIKSRHFTWITNVDELFIKVMTQCVALERVLSEQLHVTPEDHPEMDAVGFRVHEANEVWLIKRAHVQAAMKTGSSMHPAALSLMQNANGRRTLGKALAKGDLTNSHTGTATMLSNGRGIVKEKSRAEERVRIDLSSRPIAAAFLERARRKV